MAISVMGFAQSTKGTIAGVVSDSTGAVVARASVTVTSDDNGETHTTASTANGEYRVEALIPGTYTVVVEGTGFAKTEVRGVVVRTSQVTSSNVVLSVAQKSETVMVEAGADTLQTDSGELSKTIPGNEVKDVPILTGNAYALATTLPGIVTVAGRDDFTNGASFSVNGLRPRANNFLIDGFDNNDNGISGQAFQPANQEAVQEVTVKTGDYTAEYGRGGASVSNLTFRSGSNNLHGAAWYSYDGSRLDALTTQQSVSGFPRVPQYVNQTSGFRIGGPIKKDKLFFFATSQWNHNFGASTFASQLFLPTANGVAALQSIGNNSNVAILVNELSGLRGVSDPANFRGGLLDPNSPNVVNIGDRPGCTNGASTTNCLIEVGPFTRQDHTATRSYEWTVRADYIATPNDTLYARFTNSQNSFAPDLFANPTALPSIDTQQGGPARLFGAMWTHTFSPFLINEFRFSAQQIDFGFDPTAAALANPFAHLPGLSLSDDLTNVSWGGFGQGGFPQGRGHKTFQFQDAVSWNRGSHAFKIGADITLLLIRDQVPFNADGLINFSAGGDCSAINLVQCTDLANYLDGFSGPDGVVQRTFGNPLLSVPTVQHAYYFQDSWKVRPNLTLNYGVRYEYQPPDMFNVTQYPAVDRKTILTAPFQTQTQVQPDRNNFAPRFGFSYSPKFAKAIFGEDKTVIRGGYGMFYDVLFTNIADNNAANAPNALGLFQIGGPDSRGLSNALSFLQSAGPVVDPTALVESEVSNLRNPQIHQWNLNIQRELPGKLILETAYVGTRGEKLFVNEQLNPKDPTQAGDPRLNPNKGSIIARTNRGDSIYHGLQATVSRTTGALTLRGSYTWSRSIDNQSEVFTTSGGASRWENVFDPRSDRGPSAFNRSQRAAISYVYELPRLKNHGLLTTALGGWSTSGTISFQTGVPETIYLRGYDMNGDGETNNDRPFLGNASAPNRVGQFLPDGTLVNFFTQAADNNANDFQFLIYPKGSGKQGNVGRNSFTYPGRQDWNLSAIKRFTMPYREGHVLEVRADFFNAFNHPNEGVTNLDGNLLSKPTFLNLDNSREGGRQVTVWLKYSF